MPSEGTTRRSIRIPDPLWRAAMDKADTQNTRLSELIRGWLHEYVHEGEK